jgi:hypothetical protein
MNQEMMQDDPEDFMFDDDQEANPDTEEMNNVYVCGG